MLSMTMGHIVCEKGIFSSALGSSFTLAHTQTNTHIHSETVKNVRNHNPKTTHWGAFKLISFWTCASATMSVSTMCTCVSVWCVWCIRVPTITTTPTVRPQKVKWGNTWGVCLGTHGSRSHKEDRERWKGVRERWERQGEIIMNLSCIRMWMRGDNRIHSHSHSSTVSPAGRHIHTQLWFDLVCLAPCRCCLPDKPLSDFGPNRALGILYLCVCVFMWACVSMFIDKPNVNRIAIVNMK